MYDLLFLSSVLLLPSVVVNKSSCFSHLYLTYICNEINLASLYKNTVKWYIQLKILFRGIEN